MIQIFFQSKIITTVVSYFSSNYVFYWNQFFPTTKLEYPPTFDSRIVCYPSEKNLRDYLSWRQVDCHINNLYNCCFWNLVKSGKTTTEAEARLKVKLELIISIVLTRLFHLGNFIRC